MGIRYGRLPPRLKEKTLGETLHSVIFAHGDFGLDDTVYGKEGKKTLSHSCLIAGKKKKNPPNLSYSAVTVLQLHLAPLDTKSPKVNHHVLPAHMCFLPCATDENRSVPVVSNCSSQTAQTQSTNEARDLSDR